MVLLFGLCFLLLLIAAPVIVLRFGMHAGSKRELERIKPELDQPKEKS
ncbi:MAG: hypothetical protein JOZ08_09075 [Verrucomicrobia bacterium]|nr:hypothetical protein [Verrucomicrobiota bacterium]